MCVSFARFRLAAGLHSVCVRVCLFVCKQSLHVLIGEPCPSSKPLTGCLFSWSIQLHPLLLYRITAGRTVPMATRSNHHRNQPRWRACREIWGCGYPKGEGMELKISPIGNSETWDTINTAEGGELDMSTSRSDYRQKHNIQKDWGRESLFTAGCCLLSFSSSVLPGYGKSEMI